MATISTQHAATFRKTIARQWIIYSFVAKETTLWGSCFSNVLGVIRMWKDIFCGDKGCLFSELKTGNECEKQFIFCGDLSLFYIVSYVLFLGQPYLEITF